MFVLLGKSLVMVIKKCFLYFVNAPNRPVFLMKNSLPVSLIEP